MAARTVEELGDDLDDGLQWRRSELVVVRAEVAGLPDARQQLPLGRALLRSGTLLLYAHWEGFTKQACQAYLDFVARRRLKVRELSDDLVRLALDHLVSGWDDPAQAARMIEMTRSGGDVRARIPRKGIVDTRGNLRHDVLVDIFGSLGLPAEVFEMKGQMIDRSLCDVRNAIAHGRENFPTRAEYLALHDEVVPMIESVRDLVIAAATAASYRAKEAV